MKKRLRERGLFPNEGEKSHVLSVYNSERALYLNSEGKMCFDTIKKPMAKLDCLEGLGSVSFVTGAMGFAAANAVINSLLVPDTFI